MIYLQMGILILEIGLCMLLNNLLKNKTNKKIRYAICIALLINCEYIKLDRDKSTFKSHRDFSSEIEITFKHF